MSLLQSAATAATAMELRTSPQQPTLSSSDKTPFFFSLNTAFGCSNQMVSDGLRLYFFKEHIIYLWCFCCVFQLGKILPEG